MSWQRLSPRMLLVHPVHELLRQLPLVVAAVLFGSASGDPLWVVVVLVGTVVIGMARWATTSYRIAEEEVQLRTGLLRRATVAVPRNRIRSVVTEVRLLHRLLGLTVIRVATGQQADRDSAFVLDAVRADQVPALRAVLLADAEQDDPRPDTRGGAVLARWEPSWLRYSPLSVSGLATLAAALGVAYQIGGEQLLREGSWLGRTAENLVARWGVVSTVGATAVLVVVVAVVLAMLRSLLVYGNLELSRRGGVLRLRHGLTRLRERTFDMSRLRGGVLREPLLVRAVGGARVDAVMTGVAGAGAASVLLPPCPAPTARRVLTELVGDPDVVTGPLRPHGPAAARRRWTRALAAPAAAALVLAVLDVPAWWWAIWLAVLAGAALLALDRVHALGHRVSPQWLVGRAGSVERRRDCLATAGIIAWSVRQSWFQRRAGVATLIAATAAGVKAYQLIDVPIAWAWDIAATASPWVADSVWAQRR
ncbi:PH domain-containing protein [Mycolicibacillus parakoreensis]|uniref:PH domain-containing protein n=1 Tax=Mycolicibacillus parakoreensis TaxID=1069221 RepID=A0ABY3TXE3_9MYCO|nr:PH domain-containing protein [Mycolicibacillus parakoreensis]MCV7315971.1 PH domain-containing protein [Mycolicibacillus parakoreensis]ULN52398.1 PH domain-containing protein [Mycolicibacillus parakoreensis]